MATQIDRRRSKLWRHAKLSLHVYIPRREAVVPFGMEGAVYCVGGRRSVPDALWVGMWSSSHRIFRRAVFAATVLPIGSMTLRRLAGGDALEFCVSCQNMQCSILFNFDVCRPPWLRLEILLRLFGTPSALITSPLGWDATGIARISDEVPPVGHGAGCGCSYWPTMARARSSGAFQLVNV